MGVPKFFRYISERYPCLSELVRENQIPEFDNLYLDMNGIIHNCSHPDDGNIQFRITEEQIFQDIFHYIETLFRLIQPQKLFFMAVDGVAPRAKMNQQRGRRFRSAKDAENQEEQARSKGELLPDTARFDSNCITPGTAFMARLQEALKYFVKSKVTSNRLWQKCRIILSGHETPGEGEHKIMEYIRFLKAKRDFDPNTRHCLYGLDADLVMLGLCSHEIHFSLLREEVKFGNKAKKSTSVDNTRFFLLHLGLLRNYLELEFNRIKEILPFKYDMEYIIDDWILMGFLVGNDFIPHLPNLHINSNALPILYNAYMEVLPTLDGYINEGGKLNLKRFEVFMTKLAELDRMLFEEHYSDLKYLQSKQKNEETFDVYVDQLNTVNMDADLLELVKSTADMFENNENEDMDDDTDTFEKEFHLHKRDYYIKKMHYAEMTPEVLAEQTECYIRALQWTLYYYYRGVKSWGWYYPHHYAPYMSDITNFSHLQIDFEIGKAFLPFQQLLAVLPAASKSHLPAAYHDLMENSISPLYEYYPKNFETDLNGKKQEWEAVVLIPFIDEVKLLLAMKDCDHKLTEIEKKRNIHGPMLQYDFCETDQGPLDSIFGLAKIAHVYCKETLVWRNEVEVPEHKLILGPSAGALYDVYFPGFPTMKHLCYTGSLKSIRARVFDAPSRNDSMVITTKPFNDTDLKKIAKLYLGKEVFFGWPHLSEGKVIAVSNKDTKIDADNVIQNDQRAFDLHVKNLVDHHTNRMGINLGEITILVHVLPLVNRVYVYGSHGKMTLTKMWGSVPSCSPIQTIVEDIVMYNPNCIQFKSVEDVFKKNSTVFMISTIYYGSRGVVIDPTPVKICGRIKICLTVYPEPDFSLAKEKHFKNKAEYMNSFNAASTIGISNRLFSRITGSIFVVLGTRRFPVPDYVTKLNIGLQLKFPKKNEEVVSYTKKVNGQYTYSQKAINIVSLYCKTYPSLFQFLSKNNSNTDPFESDIFPNQPGEIEKLSKWIKEQPHFTAEKRSCGCEALENETLLAIVTATNELKNLPLKSIKLQVKPHLLFKPDLNQLSTPPDVEADYRLFDRVVIATDMYSVPLGLKGTIFSKQSVSDPNPVRQSSVKSNDMFYDVLFDQPFDEGFSINGIAEKRVYKVAEKNLINISYGISKFSNMTEKPKEISNSCQKSTSEQVSIERSMPNSLMPRFNNEISNTRSVDVSNSNLTSNVATSENEKIWNMLCQKNECKIKPDKTNDTLKTTDDVSDVLRKILKIQQINKNEIKISDTATTADNVAPPTNKYEMNSIYEIDTFNLPKPPQNWRNKPQSINSSIEKPKVNNNGTKHYFPPTPITHDGPNFIYHPQPFQHNTGGGLNIDHPTAASMQNVMLQHTNNIQKQSQQPQGPNGPQNLSNNSMYLPGQGAFIPLQAALQQTKIKSSNEQTIQKQLNGSTSSTQAHNASPPKCSEDVAEQNDAPSMSKPKNFMQFRPSRIAARFDLGPN